MIAYRTSIHKTTKATPFSLVFGQEVQLPINIMFGKPLGVTTPVLQSMPGLWSNGWYQPMSISESTWELNRGRGKMYKEGDSVWLYCPAVPQGHSNKLKCLIKEM